MTQNLIIAQKKILWLENEKNFPFEEKNTQVLCIFKVGRVGKFTQTLKPKKIIIQGCLLINSDKWSLN